MIIMTPLQVTDSNLHTFLDGWLDNRVRAIFFTQKEALSARFLTPGYFYRDNVAFGYINTHDPDARATISKYNVNKYRETMLMFNEETNSPVATVSVSQSVILNFLKPKNWLVLSGHEKVVMFFVLLMQQLSTEGETRCVFDDI